MPRKKKPPASRRVTLTITCPVGSPRTEVIDRPADMDGWADAAAQVESALCGCGRPHHAVYSDDPPHVAPQPLVLHRNDRRAMPGAA